MNKRIEELVKKYSTISTRYRHIDAAVAVRAALTELAAGYEERIITLKNELLRESEERCRMSEAAEMLQERIRQLEAERVPDGWQRVTVEPTEYEIQAACKALWESESHPMLTRAGYNTNFEFLPETILLGLRKKVRAIRTAMLAAAPQQKKEE